MFSMQIYYVPSVYLAQNAVRNGRHGQPLNKWESDG